MKTVAARHGAAQHVSSKCVHIYTKHMHTNMYTMTLATSVTKTATLWWQKMGSNCLFARPCKMWQPNAWELCQSIILMWYNHSTLWNGNIKVLYNKWTIDELHHSFLPLLLSSAQVHMVLKCRILWVCTGLI